MKYTGPYPKIETGKLQKKHKYRRIATSNIDDIIDITKYVDIAFNGRDKIKVNG